MQLSNGVSNPAGMWLGHLLFDGIPGLIIATVITAVFAATQSDQFKFLPLLVCHFLQASLVLRIYRSFQWFVMVLYGYTSTLFAYCISRISSSGLAAFSICAGYQVVMFMARTNILSLIRLAPDTTLAVHLCISFDTYLRKTVRVCQLYYDHSYVNSHLR